MWRREDACYLCEFMFGDGYGWGCIEETTGSIKVIQGRRVKHREQASGKWERNRRDGYRELNDSLSYRTFYPLLIRFTRGHRV